MFGLKNKKEHVPPFPVGDLKFRHSAPGESYFFTVPEFSDLVTLGATIGEIQRLGWMVTTHYNKSGEQILWVRSRRALKKGIEWTRGSDEQLVNEQLANETNETAHRTSLITRAFARAAYWVKYLTEERIFSISSERMEIEIETNWIGLIVGLSVIVGLFIIVVASLVALVQALDWR